MLFFPARPTRPFILMWLLAAALSLPACDFQRSSEERALEAELRKALREHSYEKASALARRRLAAAPHDNGAWAQLVRAQMGSEDLAGARRTLVDWQSSSRKPPPKLDELAGDIAQQEGNMAHAVQCWTKALAAQPKDLGVMEKLARGYHAQELWADEDAILTRTLALEETGPARMERALCRRRMHRWSEALADSHRAQELAADDPDVRRGTKLFERLGKFLAAIRELDARLALSPGDDQTLTDRSLLFLRSEDAELALADAELASREAPWALRPKLFHALALIALGRADECEALGVEKHLHLSTLSAEFLETMSRLDSEISVERSNAELYLARAWQLNDIAQPRLALADAELALEHDPNLAGAHAERSYALTKLGRAEEAFEQIKRATELDPGYATGWQYRGELELARGEVQEAVDSLSHALAITQSYPALLKREQAYRQLGLTEKAEEDRHALEGLAIH